MTETLSSDLRQVLRALRRAPGFLLIVVLTLGAAVGANLAVFGLLDKLVLRPLPVEKPGQLAIVKAPALAFHGLSYGLFGGGDQNQSVGGLSYPLYRELRDRVPVFRGMLAQRSIGATLVTGSEPVRVRGVLVTGNYFEVLGVKADSGRVLAPDDDKAPGTNPVVVISHGFWQRQFGGDPSILGRVVRINRIPMTVVGVAAAGFTGLVAGVAPDVFVPMCMADTVAPLRVFKYDSPGFSSYVAVARLASGIAWTQAEKETDRVYQRLLADSIHRLGATTEKYRSSLAAQRATLAPGGYAFSQESALSRSLTLPLTLVMAMVALVLVVAAVNVGNLLLARAAARSHETAIRYALGSSRWRILGIRLWESLVLSSAAGVLGLLLARWTTHLAPAVLDIDNLPVGVTAAPDHRSAVAAGALAIATGLGIWLVSALPTTRRSTLAALAGHGGIGTDRRALLWHRGMVVAQIALSLVLLCSSVMLSRSLVRLMSVDPGFPADRLYSFTIQPGQAGYDGDRAAALLDQVLDQTGGLPGVGAVSITTYLPMAGGLVGSWMSRQDPSGDQPGLHVGVASVGPSYFQTLGMSLIAGREFARADATGSTKVAVLNASLARVLFGDANPIGRRVGYQGQPSDMVVVGVVQDTRANSLRSSPIPSLFVPFFQDPSGRDITIVFRAAKPGAVTSATARAMLQRLDPAVALLGFDSLSARVNRSLSRDRVLASMAIGFAVLASTLCAIGVFGLSSFRVTQRTREFGVRLALGATRGSIHRLVGRDVALMFAAGCAIGLVIFAAAGGVLASTLYEMSPGDPVSIAAATALLGAVTLLAAYLPARRAARLDPACTLRHE